MQFRRVLSLLLSVFLLAGLLAFPAAADDAQVELTRVEFYFNAPYVGSEGASANPGIWYPDDACFCVEGGDEWLHKYPEGSEDQGYYLMEPDEVIEAGETYYLDMSILPEEGYVFGENTVVVANSYNGRSVTLAFDPATGHLELAYTAGPGISQHPMDQYGRNGSTVEFDVYMDCDDDEGIAGYQWQYSKNNGQTWSNNSSAAVGYNTTSLQMEVAPKRDGWLYRCVITDDWGETIISDPARLVLQKSVSSVDLLTEQPISGTSVNDVAILDPQGNDITGDQLAMMKAYHCCFEVSFELADHSAYPDAFIGNREYLVTIYGYVEGMDNTNEYYFTDDLTVTWNGLACEVSDVYDTGFTATTTFTTSDCGLSLDLTYGPVGLEEDNGQALANTLLALYKRQYAPLMLWYEDHTNASFGNINPDGYVDYNLDLNHDDLADVRLRRQNGCWTMQQLETCTLKGPWSAALEESEKLQLDPTFFDWIKIIPSVEILDRLELTFTAPEIGSDWCDPNLRAANPDDVCLEGFNNWEVKIVENGDEGWTPDLGTFTAGETYRIEGSVIAEAKAITLDTEIIVTSDTGRAASWEWEDDPQGYGSSMAIYFTLGAAITEQPRDAYGDAGDNVQFHVGVNGDVSYRWQYSKNGGTTWNYNSSNATGYNTDTLTMGVTATRDGWLYRCELTDSVTGEIFHTEPARLVMRKAITSLDLTIAEPRPGDSFDSAQVLDARGNPMGFDEIEDTYHCSLELWFESDGASNCLEAGQSYQLVVSAFIDFTEDEQGNQLSEYYFADNVAVTVNGKACELQEQDIVSIYAVCSFDVDYPVVPEVIFSFVRPEPGPVGNDTIAQISWDENNGLYTIMTEEAYWMTESEEPDPTTSGGYVYDFDNFEYGKTYIFEVMLEGIGTIFTEDTVYTITDNLGNAYTPVEIIQDEEYKDYAYLRVACTLTSSLTITTQPVDFAGAEGSTAIFTVEVAGGAEPYSFQWWVKKPSASRFSKSSITGPTYSVELTEARNGNQVYCVVTDAQGNSVTSNTAAMTISARELTITHDIDDFSGAVGDTASFTVEVAGGAEPYSFQWWVKKPSASRFSKSSITGPTYSVELTEARNGNQVYCVVTDAQGNSVTSNTAAMTISARELTITHDIDDFSGAVGDTASFTVEVAGGAEPYTFQWWVKKPSASRFSKSSITGPTYSVELTEARNGNQVYCVVTDAQGNSVTSATAAMTVG